MDHTCFSAEGRGKEQDTVLEELVIVGACPSSDSERVPCYCLRTLGTSVQGSLPFLVGTRQITCSNKYPLWGWDSLSFAQNFPLNSRCTKKPFQEENNAIRTEETISFGHPSPQLCPEAFCHLLLWCLHHTQPLGSQPGAPGLAPSIQGLLLPRTQAHFPNLLPFLSLPPVILLRGCGT